MTDQDLRALERDALASGDSLSWQRYYDELRRVGKGQPSGEATWLIDLPSRAVAAQLMFTRRGEDVVLFRELAMSIESEWKRCVTGVPVKVLAFTQPRELIIASWRDCMLVPPTPTLAGVQARDAPLLLDVGDLPEHPAFLGLRVSRVQRALGQRFEVSAPEFLGPPTVLALRAPVPGTPSFIFRRADGSDPGLGYVQIRPGDTFVVNPDAMDVPVFVEGTRVSSLSV